MKEPTFQRCPHDIKNPYVMISREMAQDKSISPKARGVLLYILSLPSDWKIYHSQLQEGLGVGEEYLNSALDELIAAGYADRSRERINGMYQPYKYIIREFKKCLPNRENQAGSSSPENPVLHNKEDISTKETTTKQTAVAAFFEKQPETQEPHVMRKSYQALDNVNIPLADKIWISEHYDQETVKNAVSWATNPITIIKTTLVQAIKWACAERPETPKNLIEIEKDNKDYALAIQKQLKKSSNSTLEVLNMYIEIVDLGNCQPCVILYSEKDFKTRLNHELEKRKLL